MLKFRNEAMKAALAAASVLIMTFAPLGLAYAAPTGAGQPNVECEDAGAVPGHSDMAPGSAFAEDGKSGTVYAGEQDVNSKNTKSVSQYDIACFKVP